MNNTLRNPGRPSVRAWAMAIGAVALVETVVAVAVPAAAPIEQGARVYLAGRTPSFDESVLQWQLDRLWHMERPAELLVVGDSSALIGLLPALLQERTGLEAESLATIAHLGVHGQADVLQTYLERHPGAPPKVVVAQFGDWSLVTSDADAQRIGMRQAVRTWLGRSDVPESHWPAYRLRARARRLVGGDWHQPGARDDAVRDHLRAHRGQVPDPKPTEDWGAVERPRPGVHIDAAQGLFRLARLAQDAGATLLLVHPPVPEVFDSPTARASYAESAGRLRALLDQVGHGELVEPFSPVRPTRLFSSVDHLTAEGARKHTEAVAKQIIKGR